MSHCLITLDDLKNYQAKERTPLKGSYRGYEIITMPPPSSGGLNQIFMGMMPFMGIQVIAVILLYVFPAIGLWLPGVLYK